MKKSVFFYVNFQRSERLTMENTEPKNAELPSNKEKLSGIERRKANLKPLKKFSECTPEEIAKQKEIIAKGGQANKERLAQKKTMKECALTLLDTVVSKDKAKKLLNTDEELPENMTVQDVIMLKAFNEIIENGSVRFAEFIRDTSGQTPKITSQVDVNADIITASDRALLDKVSHRLRENDD